MKIVTVGGGTGGSIVDAALTKEFTDLTAIVTSFDNGGSTGILRREFGEVPQGDIRRRIFAQRTIDNPVLEQIYNYRFGENNSLENHSVGNLMILTAQKIWGEKQGLKKVCELFKIKGKVLAVTYDYAELAAKLKNGVRLQGEDLIGQSPITLRNFSDDRKIEKVYLTRETKINPDVVTEVLKAKFIILCPGDFYTSLIPNFLVPGFCEAIKKSNARIIFICNVMTKASETRDFKLSNFVSEAEKYLKKKIDHIVFNTSEISSTLRKKYKKQEQAIPVVNDLAGRDLRILEVELLADGKQIRHDKKKLSDALKNIFDQKPAKYVFDLDDTLIPTFKFRDAYITGDYKNLNFFENSENLLKKIGKKNLILLTYDKYGNQSEKLKYLNVKKYFSEVYNVNNLIKKKNILEKLKKRYKNLIVVGDRYEAAELYYAKRLKLKTICVAMPGGGHYNKSHHYKYDYVIGEKQDFLKVLDVI